MPSSYGHNALGFNLQNLKSLATPGPPTPTLTGLLPGGLRTEGEWKKEVLETKKYGEYRGQVSTRLRQDTKELQAAADVQVEAGVSRVESALRAKLAQTQALATGLEQAVTGINHELAGLLRAQQRLNGMIAHFKAKIGVNQSRQRTHNERPTRELTCDDVSRSLTQQENLLAGLLERLNHGLNLVTVDTEKLNTVKQRLNRDLKGKVSALKVDEAVLSVKPAELSQPAILTGTQTGTAVARAAAAGAAKVASGTYNHTWKQQTESLLQEAHAVTADAARLRKAVKQLLQEAHGASQAASQALDASLAVKINSTKLLRDELAAQLGSVQDERVKAAQQRDSLRQSLQEKQLPLQQLEARCHLRAGRPNGEAVDDEVQYALKAEAVQLAAVSAQLTHHMDAADRQIARLDELSASLLQNICDKEAAMSLEEKVALLDGRAIPAVPPTPSVLSVCSSVASGYTGLGESASQVCSRVSTPAVRSRPAHGICSSRLGDGGSISGASISSSAIARIAALEQELAAARVQTESLQKTIITLKAEKSPGSSSSSRVGSVCVNPKRWP